MARHGKPAGVTGWCNRASATRVLLLLLVAGAAFLLGRQSASTQQTLELAVAGGLAPHAPTASDPSPNRHEAEHTGHNATEVAGLAILGQVGPGDDDDDPLPAAVRQGLPPELDDRPSSCFSARRWAGAQMYGPPVEWAPREETLPPRVHNSWRGPAGIGRGAPPRNALRVRHANSSCPFAVEKHNCAAFPRGGVIDHPLRWWAAISRTLRGVPPSVPHGGHGDAPDALGGACWLPPMVDVAARLMDALEGRTLLFLGDSLSRQHFIATACLLHAYSIRFRFCADGRSPSAGGGGGGGGQGAGAGKQGKGARAGGRRDQAASAQNGQPNGGTGYRDRDRALGARRAAAAARASTKRAGKPAAQGDDAHLPGWKGAYRDGHECLTVDGRGLRLPDDPPDAGASAAHTRAHHGPVAGFDNDDADFRGVFTADRRPFWGSACVEFERGVAACYFAADRDVGGPFRDLLGLPRGGAADARAPAVGGRGGARESAKQGVPSLSRAWLRPHDIVVANVGAHLHPSASRLASQHAMLSFIEAVRDARRVGRAPVLVWRDCPPAHFEAHSGAYSQRRGSACMPLAGLTGALGGGAEDAAVTARSLAHAEAQVAMAALGARTPLAMPSPPGQAADARAAEVERNGTTATSVLNTMAATLMADEGIPVLRVAPTAAARWDAHRGRYASYSGAVVTDCLHWCEPGVPTTWTQLLVALFESAPFRRLHLDRAPAPALWRADRDRNRNASNTSASAVEEDEVQAAREADMAQRWSDLVAMVAMSRHRASQT